MSTKIYLCGGINALSDKECKDWRERVKEELKEKFDFLDPMRRDYRGKEDKLYRQIVKNDLEDIRKADYILALANQPSWGTAMEIYEAFQHKLVVTICNQENISPWLRFHSSIIVKTIDEVVEFFNRLKTDFKGGVNEHKKY